MTEETMAPKRPKRWLAFLLNLLLAPTGYVYAGAAGWAVGVAVGMIVAMASMMAWTFLFPPGYYGIPVLRGGEESLSVSLIQLGLSGLLGIHAAIIAKARKVRGLKAWALAIGLYAGVLGSAMGWRFFGPFSAYDLPAGNMIPTLNPGDAILVRGPRGACKTPDLKPGQIILSRDNGTTFIWRLVAGPGQTVELRAGRLVIDGVTVKSEPLSSAASEGRVVRETLPNGARFLTLDLQEGSRGDDTASIKVPAGHWYALGDNRDNALDSRFNGPIPASKICAVAVKILYSDDKAAIGRRLD